jgi:hypothetical protein
MKFHSNLYVFWNLIIVILKYDACHMDINDIIKICLCGYENQAHNKN